MNELMLFNNKEFGEIRGIEIEGKPYVVANDVLKALGYAEGSWSTTLKRKCKGVTNCKGLEYRGNLLNLIPEGDIYRLIFSSKLPSAQKLNKLLNENKIIYKQGKNWYTYSNVDKSWYKLIVGNSNEHNYSQLKFTPKGVYEISKLLQIEFDEEDLEQIS